MLQVTPDALETLFGLSRDTQETGVGETALRAFLVYSFTLLIVRLGSKRLLGKATAFDVILAIMIGSVMSRGINGSNGLAATFAGGATLVAMHWLFGVLSYHTSWFGNLVKGKAVLLVEDGRVLEDAMRGSSLSERDLYEAIRLSGESPDPSKIRRAYLERNGNISVIPNDPPPRVIEVSAARGVQTIRIQLS